MAMTSQQTFVDRMNEAENALGELANYADRLTSRLVGYADEQSADGYGEMPSSGILPDVASSASRMLRKISDIRSALRRVEESLPSDNSVGVASAGGKLDRAYTGQFGTIQNGLG